MRRDRSFTRSSERQDGSEQFSDSQGRTVQTRGAFDPQFPLASYAGRSQGLGAVVEQRRDFQVAGDGSLGTIDRTETTVVDGRTYTRHYDSATRTWTSTSPQGRQHTAQFNLQGQPVRQTAGGLADVAYHYRADGRLDEVRVGAGADQRVIRVGYGAQGYLEWVEDPAGRRVSYDRDDAGRPEQITLPDSRVIGLGWDAESNLTRVTPPGRPAHEFDYTPTNKLAAYRPPSAGAATGTRITRAIWIRS
ncbi:MAG: hypothetical protein IPH76_17310 [Xanthomonadales bacterium]|nr:hypothetical protein [Xanthomonadales bacterium]